MKSTDSLRRSYAINKFLTYFFLVLRKNTPKALTRPGNTRAKIVFAMPILATIWYWGIMKIWLGRDIWTSLLAMLPMIVLYLFFQRQFVEGIAGTGGK